jgi:hypothetical protein
MPRPDPVKSFLMAGGADCEEVKITHSNKLQEAKSYNYVKKRPDENNPLKFYLLNFGNSVQPGDPVILKATISGSGHVEVQEDNADQNTYGSPGSARVVLDPPWEMDEVRLIWPCEFEVVDNTSIGYSSPGFTLRSRRQRPDYNPSLSNADIEAHPYFSASYNDWLETRFYDWKRRYGWGTEVPDPEDYEIVGKKNQILSSLRDYFSRQWYDWEDHYVTQSQLREGEYWTGGRDSRGRAIYLPYSFWIIPELSPKLCREDGSEIDGEGLDPITLLGYEFISDPRSDINNIDDWLEVLRINFMGTPAPLTIECTEPCEEGCLPVYANQGTSRLCVCKDTKVNDIDDYDYQPYGHNQSKPRLNEFNP